MRLQFLKRRTNVRLIVDNIQLHITIGQVLRALGGDYYLAVREGIYELDRLLAHGEHIRGLTGRWYGHSVQIDWLDYPKVL
jgi:hypothetical protein